MPLTLPPTALFGLISATSWGSADFLGGMAAKRAPALLTTCFTHATALAIALSLALGTHAAFPPWAAIGWGLAAGASGSTALALFYHSLASGHMGLKTAIAALLGAAIPAVLGVVTDGWPHPMQAGGFALAVVAIVLFTWEDGGFVLNQDVAIAALCGVAFSGFYIFARQAGAVSPFWLACCTRVAGLSILLPILLVMRPLRAWKAKASTSGNGQGNHNIKFNVKVALGIGMVAGVCDLMGTLFFIFASQRGRLDVAVVLSSLYPGVTVLLAWLFLKEKFTSRRGLAMAAALLAVPLIAAG